MTTGIAQIPLAIGASAAGFAAKGLAWGFAQFARSPMASTGLVLASGLILMAGTNALFLQDTRHPAPMFASGAQRVMDIPEPIAPVVVQPESVPQRPAGEPVASITAAEPASVQPATVSEPSAIGNQDIADLQGKLMALGMFDGTVDGYYGPKTADAIRAFEARFGLPRTGAATPQVIEAVKRAPLETSQAPAPVDYAPAPSVVAEPSADELGPLIAQMQEDSATAMAAAERQTVADLSPDVPQPAQVTAEPTRADVAPVLNEDLVSEIQRGLTRLGFLQGAVNGVADEATARAIRQFQIFNNFRPTGEVSPMLRQMLVEAGAFL